MDVKQLVRNYDPTQGTVTWNNNILPMPWTGPGSGNAVLDPMLKHIPDVSETKFTTWQQAQVMRDWFSLLPGSPARGTGPNGMDKGGVIPFGASISGEPRALTSMTTATLTVGLNRTGSGIPTAGFPLGSGFTHYRWRLDSSAWSAETPIATPIKLTGLASGSHHVDVIGKNDAGWYQNDPALGPDAVVTTSRTWTVDPSYQRLILNEILVVNHSAQGHEGTYPGVVELYYDGAAAFDLSGMRLTNDATKPTKFVFPAGSKITPGQYLVLYADTNATTSGLHLGFTLNAGGDSLFLYNTLGVLVDSVTFGPQLTDLSIGRVGPDDAWCLTIPTLGQANVAQPCGDAGGVKINEWLARREGRVCRQLHRAVQPECRAGGPERDVSDGRARHRAGGEPDRAAKFPGGHGLRRVRGGRLQQAGARGFSPVVRRWHDPAVRCPDEGGGQRGLRRADRRQVPGTRARWGEHDHVLTRAHAGHGQYPHAKGCYNQSHLGGTSGG